VRNVGTDAEESFAGAAIFDGVLRFFDGRSVKFDGSDSRSGIEQAKRHGSTETASGSGDDRDFSVKTSRPCPRHMFCSSVPKRLCSNEPLKRNGLK
jgi:hypothetical protein